MIILIIPLVYPIYGGETVRYLFEKCDELRVNVTAEVLDSREYIILNDCEEEDTNYWVCDCYDHYYFDISFMANAVNNYTLYFNYDYSKMITETSGSSRSSGGGGGGGGYNSLYWKDKFANKTVTIEELEELVEEIKDEEEIPKEVIEELEEIIEEAKALEPEEKSNLIYWIIGGIVVVIVGGVIFFLFNKD